MRRVVPENASFWDRAHLAVGLLAAVLSVTFLLTHLVGARWRGRFPWLAGNFAETGRDVAGLFRGRIPPADGAGLFPAIQGVLLLLFVAAAVTGAGWLAADGSRAALAWREWHALAANAFGWCLLAHVVAAAAHVLEFLRD